MCEYTFQRSWFAQADERAPVVGVEYLFFILDEKPVCGQVENDGRAALGFEPAFPEVGTQPGPTPKHPGDLPGFSPRACKPCDRKAERRAEIASAPPFGRFRGAGNKGPVIREVEIGIGGNQWRRGPDTHHGTEADYVAAAVEIADAVVVDQEAAVVGGKQRFGG